MSASTFTRRRLLKAACAGPVAGLLAHGPKSLAAADRPPFNSAIDKAWQSGLAALKPSAKDLEHGLELHADAIVFDCYGFSPRSAVDGDKLAQAAAQGA